MDVFCCWPLGFSCRHSLCAKAPRFPIYSNQVRNPTGSRRIVTLCVISETAGWQTACVSSHLPGLAVSHRKLKANNTTTGISCIDISTYSLSVIHCLIGQLCIVPAECRQSPQYCSYLQIVCHSHDSGNNASQPYTELSLSFFSTSGAV